MPLLIIYYIIIASDAGSVYDPLWIDCSVRLDQERGGGGSTTGTCIRRGSKLGHGAHRAMRDYSWLDELRWWGDGRRSTVVGTVSLERLVGVVMLVKVVSLVEVMLRRHVAVGEDVVRMD